MISCFILNVLPLWLNYILIVTLIVFAIKGGMFFAKWRKKRGGTDDDSSINTLVGATLGLLALMLERIFYLKKLIRLKQAG